MPKVRLSYRGLVIQFLKERDGDNCKLCEERLFGSIHIDHIIPLAREGADDIHNLQLSHRGCNLGKRDKIFGVKLNGGSLAKKVELLVKESIVEALTLSRGHQKHAGELLGMGYRAFRHTAVKYGVDLHCGDRKGKVGGVEVSYGQPLVIPLSTL